MGFKAQKKLITRERERERERSLQGVERSRADDCGRVVRVRSKGS